MDLLVEKFRKKIARVSTAFSRSLINRIDWSVRLIGIKGARGVGKTTLLLQYIKKNFKADESVPCLYPTKKQEKDTNFHIFHHQ